MGLRKRETQHKVSSDAGEFTIVLTEPEDSPGAVLSNWQMVLSDDNGVTLVFTQLNFMGADPAAHTIEGHLQAHLVLPHSVAKSFHEALGKHVQEDNDKEQAESETKVEQ